MRFQVGDTVQPSKSLAEWFVGYCEDHRLPIVPPAYGRIIDIQYFNDELRRRYTVHWFNDDGTPHPLDMSRPSDYGLCLSPLMLLQDDV